MELTLNDVRELALELWLAQREAAVLRAENAQLRAQAAATSPTGADDGDPRGA
ncbi:hypothetical protein ABZ749_01020 [Micromonospora sp. NPDC047753]|uniref:hypothetical protein n=1 Tax=Micromonospora sp. NPDC047753 TaxID=3154817 RepID=UPI0033F22AA5